MFYAEELKRDVLSLKRVPKGTKNAVDKSLSELVADDAITAAEKTEIVELTDYRNVIGHQMHNLFVDLSNERAARQMIAYCPDLLPKYDYKAIERLQHFRGRLSGLWRTHHYVTELRLNGLLFHSAEKIFLTEIKRLEGKLSRLAKIRRKQTDDVNNELSAITGTEFEGDLQPLDPLNHYDDGRLTKRGVEICYRLFDVGKSAMTVAHLTGLSLIAVRKRQRRWTELGGVNRVTVDIAAIPPRKFYARHRD
jgi:superfamily I DNA/RNA helicase